MSEFDWPELEPSKVLSDEQRHLLWRPIVVRAGTMRVLVSNHDPGSGAIKWTMLYVPIDDGASVVAA